MVQCHRVYQLFAAAPVKTEKKIVKIEQKETPASDNEPGTESRVTDELTL